MALENVHFVGLHGVIILKCTEQKTYNSLLPIRQSKCTNMSIKETWYKTNAAIWYKTRLPEDEPSGSKRVEDIKINIKIFIWKICIYFVYVV